VEVLAVISHDIWSHEDTMLMYCSRRVRELKIPGNIEVKKIPRDLLAKCAFEEGK